MKKGRNNMFIMEQFLKETKEKYSPIYLTSEIIARSYACKNKYKTIDNRCMKCGKCGRQFDEHGNMTINIVDKYGRH